MFDSRNNRNNLYFPISGPLSGALYRKFGCRIVIQIGGLIASTGLMLSYFAEEVYHLYLTFLLVGIGFGLVYSPSVGILPDYFDKYRYFATSFATVGSAVGTLTFSPVFLYLINEYTWRGSMFINAGIALQIVVLGTLMKSRTLDKNLNLKQVFELHLFRDIKFLTLFFDGICFGGGIFVVFGLANQLVISHGLDKRKSALLVSVMGICNATGRFSSSIIAHCSCSNRLVYFAFAGCLCGLFACLASLCEHFWSFVVTLGLFGVFFGAKLSQLASANMELFGPKRLITTIGYSMFSFGIGGLLLPLLAGLSFLLFSLLVYYSSQVEGIFGLCFLGLIADRSRIENSYIMAGSCILTSFCLLCVFVVRLRKDEQQHVALISEPVELLNVTYLSQNRSMLSPKFDDNNY